MPELTVSTKDTLFEFWTQPEITPKESLIWISESKKLLYLKSPKCASTSIAKTLIRNIDDMRNLKTYKKAPDFSKYYKFSFVRNPWDRFVSMYHNYYDTNKLKRDLNVPFMSFDEFIKSTVYFDYRTVKIHAMPITELTTFNGIQQMDFIGRVENIKNDFKKLKRYVNKDLPRFNKTLKRQHYSTYYSEETKQIIADLYYKDIEAFGYKFELEKK